MASTRERNPKQSRKRVLLAVIRPAVTRISGVLLKDFCLSMSLTWI